MFELSRFDKNGFSIIQLRLFWVICLLLTGSNMRGTHLEFTFRLFSYEITLGVGKWDKL